MTTSEDFIGQNALISYLSDNNRTTKSYWRFLTNHRDIIIASIDTTSNLDNWKNLDNLWAVRFLREKKDFLKKDFPDLKDKVIAERFRYAKTLKIFCQEIIKEYKKNQVFIEENNEKENIVLADFADSSCSHISNSSHSKKNVEKYNKKEKHKLDIKSNIHPFYEISNENIKNSMDLFTIISKLENNQYAKLITKQIRILEQNKDKLVYRQVVNDALLIASAYENLIANNILPFIELLKTFLLTRSQISLSSANEPVLQAIVENLLPLKYRIPELSLVMDGTKLKGFGQFGYSDIFILKGIGNNNVSLELKYISLVGLIKKKKFNTNDLENLDKIIEKEDEKILLKRSYEYWSKEHNETKKVTIEEVLNNGIKQLKSYMNIISKGKPNDYYSSGIFDKRIKITKSNPNNKLKGFVILVIGF
ncbi:uncharacterized protein OCT59_027103 [Rhizophagus irregularis]|uniref:uncharacterized protein n=1 Tax=Rhizophagus irregularis TaxID=588596 RepID=UPI003329418B|nr:hypothetical protein OCT59_027103 [Rhizophagus irregularis]